VQIAVALALAAGVTVSLGWFYAWTSLPLAAVFVLVTWRPLAPRVSAISNDAATHTRGAAWALGAAGAWMALNWILTSEYLLVVRDPGFLTLSGLWLTDHPSTDIPVLGADAAASVQANMLPDASQAWNLRDGFIQPQGAKMLPATIAMGGWLAGEWGVLGANIVVGAVGLLAVYALGRRLVGPIVALAPMAALGLTVAHIALSRSAYSEPLTLLVVIAGVAWAWDGLRHARTAPVVAGAVVTGASALIRIDGALFAAGAIAGIVIALALASGDRWWRVRTALLAVAAQALTVAVGYLSLWRWSTAYAERLGPQTTTLIKAYALLAVLLAVWAAAWIPAVRADRLLTAPVRLIGRTGARVVGGAVIAGMLVLASRPLWTTVHRGTDNDVDRFTNGVVASFQRAQGMVEDPTRTYAESTVSWISYYLTWPLVLLAFLGLGLATYWMLRGRGEWAALLGATLAPSLLYFWAPEIVPDHIWAIRRFEPMTLPAFVLAATVAAMWLVGRVRDPRRRRLTKLWAVWLIALLPITTWIVIDPGASYPVRGATPLVIRELGGARAQLHALCDVVDGRPVVLVGPASHYGPLRVMCDVPVVLALVTPTQQSLAQMASEFGEAPVVLTQKPEDVQWTADPQVLVESNVRQSGYRLQGLPNTYIDRDYAWYAGVVADGGVLEPISP